MSVKSEEGEAEDDGQKKKKAKPSARKAANLSGDIYTATSCEGCIIVCDE